MLLDHGANINALNEIYHTPLHLLLQWGYSDAQIGPLLNRFLAEGAEVNSKDFQGRSRYDLNRSPNVVDTDSPPSHYTMI